ncbi:leucine--tRNA ligase [Hymenobacter defluvii]|uniref:Leucine--tRNA ligase n=1 Tax=Hymenobacter defluvii TaxID=2054411 RepID=A0ABS3T9D9_9BACT|nr:class I tRNA ligase family protein [Hymenobacter defluvii]MBO3269818.1 leucine--tRNA ligase [Hymenobacter defluvii]
MPGYHPQDIEKKWQNFWHNHHTFKAENQSDKPHYYVLDMFPYPSGAGLHVGHPLGYIASDIVSRYKRLQGFNVLHPMGFDSFGLPAEQYAIQTGQHPALTTEKNIETYIRQLNSLGFSYDWTREVRTSDPSYYKWTQWIFIQLFNSWYNLAADRAESVDTLIALFEQNGTTGIQAAGDDEERPRFTAAQWQAKSEPERMAALLPYRLAYQSDTYVNWCPQLGTVLSNDEVKDGLSERGGFPVERRLMPQWNLRITAYADRLLQGLDTIDWPEAVKEMQRNWIGRSIGAEVAFPLAEAQNQVIKVYTTRVDTIYGVTFLVLAPEHELVAQLTTPEQQQAVQDYIDAAKRRSERDRMADVKTVSGVFTGSYCLNPISGEQVPIWLADYVLAGYGTGAVMAVPSGDQRDYLFAKHFDLAIVPVLDTQQIDEEADNTKEGHYINSELINGLTYKDATTKLIAALEEKNLGKGKVNYRIRDAIFGRQRYWGEPISIYYKDGTAYPLPESELPLVLPEIDEYKPTETGEPPLGRAKDWKYEGKYEYELSTMPGWAGSSWYYLRYMDPTNEGRFVGKEVEAYWHNVDLYMGGAEHATGHLLYSRFWYLFLKDLGLVSAGEPFQKLINQGMILGRSNFVYYLNLAWGTSSNEGVPDLHIPSVFISKDICDRMSSGKFSLEDEKIVNDAIDQVFESLQKQYTDRTIYRPETEFHVIPIHVDVSLVDNDTINVDTLKAWRPDFTRASYICEPDGSFVCSWEVEKMSKSKHNVVNPDSLIDKFGADALRLYEMFLGPLEQFKPWNTSGMSGVSGFLKKLWRLFHPEDGALAITDEAPTPQELKALHKAIRKAEEDIEKFSFNTSVSTFMICVNELTALRCHKRAVLEPLLLIVSPYAPHLAEELWQELGHEAGSVSYASFPEFKEEYLVEDSVNYPVAINGKVREQLQFPATATAKEIEDAVLGSDFLARFGDGKAAKKVIVVPGRMVNVVV